MKKTNPQGSRNFGNDKSAGTKDEIVNRLERDYKEFKESHTFKFPTWLYGPVKGKLLTVEGRKGVEQTTSDVVKALGI